MRRKNFKNCPSFKSIELDSSKPNKPLTGNCCHCAYFSSKNCHFEASNDIEPDFDFL